MDKKYFCQLLTGLEGNKISKYLILLILLVNLFSADILARLFKLQQT